jgi:hypothetical protein
MACGAHPTAAQRREEAAKPTTPQPGNPESSPAPHQRSTEPTRPPRLTPMSPTKPLRPF